MSLVVQKFGGTSVRDVERIGRVARRVVEAHAAGHRVAVVVSAMAGETNRLAGLARAVSPGAVGREVDVLLASGEQVSMALLALAIEALGVSARSFLASQVRILTDSRHGQARIRSIDAPVMQAALDEGTIAVVAGFQGIDEHGSVTTLGRGGSDTTAVALAASLRAQACEIYTDVEGVFTADPAIVPSARRIERVSYDEMLELASVGAKVLQTRSVEFAMKYGVPVHVRSSFVDREGTWVVAEEDTMETVVVRAVAHERSEARITLVGVPDLPGVAARVFEPLAEAGILVDMIIQNASKAGEDYTDVTFTVPRADAERATGVMEAAREALGAMRVRTDTRIAKVSVVGVGMRSHSGVAARMFRTLSDHGINIGLISTSEIKISVLIDERHVDLAVRALHEAFHLGG